MILNILNIVLQFQTKKECNEEKGRPSSIERCIYNLSFDLDSILNISLQFQTKKKRNEEKGRSSSKETQKTFSTAIYIHYTYSMIHRECLLFANVWL